MATKVDQTVVTERLMNSAITINSPKVFKFASKSGFVIPKNKLSGSLVPTMRYGGKGDPGISLREDSSKQVQRKTKWGMDMIQDAAIKKGKILAYQTRLEQLTEQLKAGLMEFENVQFLKSSTQSSIHDHAMQHQNLEQLELEKREIIGEILQLNPSFKAPSDHQPLLKVAKVPIPIKVYPECNFIGLLLGSESNTQKRLEEETGAKIVVYGTKSDTKEKHEITRSEISNVQTSYEEVYVHVSADTYNKVDAAVALLDLLLTPVSGKSASSTESKVIAAECANVVQNQMQAYSNYPMTSVRTNSQAAPQSVPVEPCPMPYQSHHNPSYPMISSGSSLPPPSQFTPAASNSVRFMPPLINPSNMPPFYGVNSPLGLVPRDSAGVGGESQIHFQVLQQPPNQAAPLQISVSTYSMSTQSSTIPASLSASTMPSFFETVPGNRAARPQSHPLPMSPVGSLPMSLGPSLIHGNSTGWPSMFPVTPVGPNNFQGNPLPISVPQGILHRGMVGKPAVGVYAGPATLSSQSSIGFGAPAFSSATTHITVNPTLAHSVAGSTVNLLPTPGQPPAFLPPLAPRPWPMPALSSNSMLANVSSPVALQVPAVSMQSASLPMANTSFVPVPPLATVVPKPQTQPLPQIASISTSITPTSLTKPPRPNPGDFTFQPLRAQVSGLVTLPRPDNLLTSHVTAQVPAIASQIPSTMLNTQSSLPVPQLSLSQTNSQVLTGAPHAPPFRPPMPNPAMPMGAVAIPRPHGANMFSLPHVPFPASPSSAVGNLGDFRPLSLQHFPSSQTCAPVNQFNIREFPGFLPLRVPLNLIPLQNPLRPAAQQHGFLQPNQHLGKVGLGPLGNQVYDPFSPTSIPNAPLLKKNEQAKLRNPQPDSEYEDLMASVGVR